MPTRFMTIRTLPAAFACVVLVGALGCRTSDVADPAASGHASFRDDPAAGAALAAPSGEPSGDLASAPVLPTANAPAPEPAAAFASDRLILPGVRVGPVSAETSEADLIALMGPARVVRGDIELGEGFTEPGTIVFPNSPDRAEILWEDAAFERPVAVLLADPAGAWRTPLGIGVGSPLALLVERNRRPCKLTGFGWDYGGTVVSWEGGALADDAALGTNCTVRVEPSREVASEKYEQVSGDRDVASDHPVMLEMEPRVYQLIVRIEEPVGTTEASPETGSGF